MSESVIRIGLQNVAQNYILIKIKTKVTLLQIALYWKLLEYNVIMKHLNIKLWSIMKYYSHSIITTQTPSDEYERLSMKCK